MSTNKSVGVGVDVSMGNVSVCGVSARVCVIMSVCMSRSVNRKHGVAVKVHAYRCVSVNECACEYVV